ncbi:UTRA domain-containing protein [Yersinia pestis]|nr:UTRA domain-containing protein [Yersinia pestis]
MAEQSTVLQLSAAMDDIPAPIYQRVKLAIIRQIRTGTWQPHQRVPSESELVTELGVSRMTINRALLEVHNIADEIAARGHRHSSQVLHLEARPASPEEAIALGIQPGQQLFYSQIVHYENDFPVQVENRCVNPSTAPDYMKQDFNQITPYSYLTQAAPLTEGEHIVEAVMPSPIERQLLELSEHEPCLLIRRRTWYGKAIVTAAQLLYPGPRYQLYGRFTPQGTVTS